MRENTLKQQLYAGKAAFGVMCTFPSPPVVEMLGYLGFVRHEVAYTAVMTEKGGHNLVCCHQYPTQACGWSNPAV